MNMHYVPSTSQILYAIRAPLTHNVLPIWFNPVASNPASFSLPTYVVFKPIKQSKETKHNKDLLI